MEEWASSAYVILSNFKVIFLQVFSYLWARACLNIFMDVYTYMHRYARIWIPVHRYMYVCTYVCVVVYLYVCTHADMYMCIHTCIYVNFFSPICAFTNMNTVDSMCGYCGEI